MKKTVVLVAMLLFLAMVAFAEDLVDVVKLKDGSIYKGIIIENKINEYVMIELAGGSQLKLQYADIDNITREKSTPAPSVTASEPAIRFFAQQGIFTFPYYSYRGSQYPLDWWWGSGYSSLVNQIVANVTPSPELFSLVANYKGQVTTGQILIWGGLTIEVAGIIWMFSNESSYLSNVRNGTAGNTTLLDAIALPAGVALSGLVVDLIGSILNRREPTELVNYYNENYDR